METKSSESASRSPDDVPAVPRGARRRDAIVAAAESVFLANGFSDTTMQQIAGRAGASKETLYRHFGSKESLFAEVVTNRARSLKMQLDTDFDPPPPLPEVLRTIGTNLLAAMTDRQVIALLRIVVAETPRDPALGRVFYTVGPERTHARLTDYLAGAQERGECRVPNVALAASIFLGAVVSQAHTARLVLQDPPPMSRADIDERVDEVVAMFLLRYGPGRD